MVAGVYLDASFIVSAFAEDTFTARTRAFMRDRTPALMVSDLGGVEFASALNRLVRMGEMSRHQAGRSFLAFDRWSRDVVLSVRLEAADLADAGGFLRRFDLNLRAPDAIHIATARRLDAEVATFDEPMAECARKLSVPVAVV